jgi:Flp pilus assembly protein TadG
MKRSSSVSRLGQRQGRFAHEKRRAGVAAVELAVLLPFLAALFVIAVDLSRVFYYQIVINNCARNGAYVGCTLRSYQEQGQVDPCKGVLNATLAEGAFLSPPLQASQVTIKNGTGSDGNPNVQVTINYPFTGITNFPGLFSTLTIRAQSACAWPRDAVRRARPPRLTSQEELCITRPNPENVLPRRLSRRPLCSRLPSFSSLGW